MARAIKSDHGTAYFTNSRLIFEGSKKPVVIRLSAILGIADAHSLVPNFSAIQLRKASGASPVCAVSFDLVISPLAPEILPSCRNRPKPNGGENRQGLADLFLTDLCKAEGDRCRSVMSVSH